MSRSPRPFFLAALAAFALTGASCSGVLGDPIGTETNPNGDAAEHVAKHSQFPRLSHTEWESTVIDLFHLDAPTGLSASFVPDPLGGKTFDNNETSLEVTPGLWADYQKAAEELALAVTQDPQKLAAIVPPGAPADAAAKRDAFLTAFGKRAFRRPLSSDELKRFGTLFDGAALLDAGQDPFIAGVRLSIEAFLQSPYFVYRPEIGGPAREDGLVPLTGWEVATKLSYALWGTMPDDELFAAAEKGDLDSAPGIGDQVSRMLAAPRTKDSILAFHDQLYEADQYVGLQKNTTQYPFFDPAMGDDMRTELSMFVEEVLFAKKGGLKELLTSRTTFVNARLAEIYGLDPSAYTNAEFVQVELDPATRTGLLTRLGFLAWKGTLTQPDTILRGVFLNRRLLCQPLGDPPPEAMGAMLGDEKTNRERVNALTGKGTCGETCHGTFINPAGYAFEHYGALGEYRTEDAGEPIDSSATFPFEHGAQTYADAIAFSDVLADAPQVHRCYAGYWLERLHGRNVETQDETLLADVAEISRGGAGIEEIITTLVTSDSFLTRVPEEVAP